MSVHIPYTSPYSILFLGMKIHKGMMYIMETECRFKNCTSCNRNLPMTNYYFKPNPKGSDGFGKKCRECSTNLKLFTDENHKYCTQCQKHLPKNKNYFDVKNVNYDKFNSRCKECCGYSYVKELIPSKEGCKICIKCERELEISNRFFPQDKDVIGGYRNVCRECSGGHFMQEGYIPKRHWTKEDNTLFVERYPHYTNAELIELFYTDMTEKGLWDKAYSLNVVKSEETYKRGRMIQSEKMYGYESPIYGIKRSDETKEKISNIMKDRWKEDPTQFNLQRSEDFKRNTSIRMKKLGKWKGNSNPRVLNPLSQEDNPNWKGGITALRFQIRNSKEYHDWRVSVFIRDNNTCQRCGCKNYNEAHHIKCFSLNEELRFDIDNGLTLCKYCHNSNYKGSLHNIYGTYDVTLEDLHEYFTGVSWDIKERKYIGNEFGDVV